MSRKMLIDAVHAEETRVVIIDNRSSILEFDFTTAAKPQVKGNVYLAKITRVEPSLQAAFVEYGGGKQGFLPFSEIHPNYYQIPVSDRQRLIEEEEAEAAREREAEEAESRRRSTRDDRKAEEEAEDKADQAEADAEEALEDANLQAGFAEEQAISAEADDDDTSSKTIAETAASSESVRSDIIPESQLESEDASAVDENGEKPEGAESEEDRANRRRRRGGRFRNRRRGGRDRGDQERGERTDRGSRESRSNGDDGDDGSDVETLSGEDELVRPQRQRNYTRRYKIQEVIKRNQVLLVQVIKEERGNKGVSLTSFLSLAGRYCVLMPNSPRGGGVSRKINSGEDRKRLKEALADLALPQGMSVIIRTAGAGHTRVEIKRDFDYLVKLWNQIREDTLQASAPALIYEESNIIQRSLRDSYTPEIDEVLVEGEEAFKDTKAFMRKLLPSHAPKVKLYKGDSPLFHKEGVEDQLTSMMEPTVRLHSGGSIVMVPTEALISIDVNSGRSTRERNVEETALKTNLEAAREIARQLRLRDLAGLIVIDFIDMMEGRNRRAVERAMKEALRHDKAKIQVGRISSFGLMEMSRQRMRPSLSESVNRACPHCKGIGFIRSEAALAIQIVRALEKEAASGHFDRFRVFVTAAEALHMLNHMRAELDKLEKHYQCEMEVVIDGTLYEGNFRIEKMRRKSTEGSSQNTLEADVAPSEEEAPEKPKRERERSRGGRNRRGNRGEKDSRDTTDATDETVDASADERVEETETSEAVTVKAPASTKKVKVEAEEAEAVMEEEGTEEASAQTDEKPKRRRGRPASKTKADAKKKPAARKAKAGDSAEVFDIKAEEVPAAPTPARTKAEAKAAAAKAEADTQPSGKKRSGWWQRIIE